MIIHGDDVGRLARLQNLATAAAREFNLPDPVVEPKRRPFADGAEGVCYFREARIGIALRFKERASEGASWWATPIDFDRVRETLGHEVAHLRFPNHGAEFKALEKRVVEFLNRIDGAG